MKPTEQIALGKAHELIKRFSSTKAKKEVLGKIGWALPREVAIEFAIEVCDQMIETLNSMKGMSRISKTTFWKLVKKNIEEQNA